MRWEDEAKVVEALARERRVHDLDVERHLERCESPIEVLFMLELVLMQHCHWSMSAVREHPFGLIADGYGELYCQHPVTIGSRRYRLDFAIVTPRQRIAVELDGHDFHERTKEQASRDKGRDRVLVAAGWKVLRFTGSEVWCNVRKSVFEIQELLWAEHEEATA